MLINGHTQVIAHIGFPTHTFKSPMIYNPYFAAADINALVVPFSSQAPVYPAFLRSLFTCENVIGALVTMPHKVTTIDLVDRLTPTALVAGSCNAVRRAAAQTASWKAICLTARVLCAVCAAKVLRRKARALWWWAAAVSARRLPLRWRQPVWRAWRCLM